MRPTSSWPKRSRPLSRRPAPREADAEGRRPRARRLARRSRSCSGCRSTRTVKCIMLAIRSGEGRVQMLLCAATTCCNEVKIEQGAGARQVSLGNRSRDRRGDRMPTRLSGSGRHPCGNAARRRPPVAVMARFRLRRQRGRFPPARRQLRPRLPRAGRDRRPPQRRRWRPIARRQGHARDRAWHRGRPRLRARHMYSKAMGATFLDATGQAQVLRDGVLRHRHDPRRRRGDRAEPRRAGHHLAGAAGAVRRGDRADRLRAQRGGQDARRPRCTTSSSAPGSKCCWTTAASALA